MSDLEHLSSLLLDLTWTEMNDLAVHLEDALEGLTSPRSDFIARELIEFAEAYKSQEADQ